MKKAVIALLSVLLFTSVSFASVPGLINYQGFLKDSAGHAVSNPTLPMTFSIYAGATGGTALWTEMQTVSVESGTFSVQLGSVSPIAISVFDGTTRYLGIKAGTDSEMTPRVALVSVPYAYRSTVADSVGGVPGSGFVNLSPAAPQVVGNVPGISIESTSTLAKASVITGKISSTTPGSYSSAVRGINNGTSGYGIGVWGSQNGNGWGVFGSAAGNSGTGVYGESDGSAGGWGVYGVSGYNGNAIGVEGDSASTAGYGGYFSNDSTGTGLYGVSAGTGVRGETWNSGQYGGSFEVHGIDPSNNAYAVYGLASNTGTGAMTYGGYFESKAGTGQGLYAKGNTVGVYGSTGSSNGYAAVFTGGQGVRFASSGPVNSGTQEGTLYYNDTTKHFFGYTASGWKQLDN
ncbi:MAG TPA: hypothetical protein VMD02_03305 [Candidatus Omnitrophota bacterium]|nr:hypothetical protein [Candidatus Omnitrophota bacterium]